MRFAVTLCFLFFYLCLLDGTVKCENDHFFLKAAKSVPRIGRRSRNQNVDDSFEKFFLKASKSVPRIGRRGPVMGNFIDDDAQNYDYYIPIQDFKYETYHPEDSSNSQKEIPEFRLQPDRFM
nr:uncharacterized protein LOC111428715 [Onthophagus taurus]